MNWGECERKLLSLIGAVIVDGTSTSMEIKTSIGTTFATLKLFNTTVSIHQSTSLISWFEVRQL